MKNKVFLGIIIFLIIFIIGVTVFIIPTLLNSTGGEKSVYPQYQVPHALIILDDAIKSEKINKNITRLDYTNEQEFAKILADGMKNIQGFYNFDYDNSLNKNKTTVKELTKKDLQNLKIEIYEKYPIIYKPNSQHYVFIIRKIQNQCKFVDAKVPQKSDCLIDIDANIQYAPNRYGKDRHILIFDGNQEQFLMSEETSKSIFPTSEKK